MEKGGASKGIEDLYSGSDLQKKAIDRTVIITAEFHYFQPVTNY